jgi:plastocyanin
MAANQIPVVDRIRIIPRPDDFLDRNIGSSGEVFFNQATSSLRVYSGKDRSGFEIARADLANISNDVLVQKLTDAGYESGGGASISVSDTIPTDPEDGQLWLETDTGILYVYYNDGDTAQWIQPTSSSVGGGANPTFKTISVDGQDTITAESSTADLHVIAGSNINISTNAATNTLTINSTASGGDGVTSNSFATINVAGQSAIVAESDTDTLTLVAGNGITLTTDSNTDTITVTNSQADAVNNFSDLTESTTASLNIDKFYRPAIAMLEVDNNGTSAYTFNSHYSGNNPRIYAISGTTIAFNLDAIPGHPFEIQDVQGDPYNTGLTHVASDGTVSTGTNAQGKSSGTLYWTIDETTAGNFRYQCRSHGAMVGIIEVKRLSLF